ncbi:Cytochrome P450 3A4 [Mactra antiquata]
MTNTLQSTKMWNFVRENFLFIAKYYSVFVAAVLILVLTIVHQHNKRLFFKNIGVNLEPTLPVIGAFYKILTLGILEHDAYSIKQFGKIHGTYLGNVPTLVVSEPNMIKEIFVKQFCNFPNRMKALYISKWWENGIVIASGEHWHYLRSLISPALSTSNLKQTEAMITKCLCSGNNYLLNLVDDNSSVDIDIKNVFSALTMDIICATAFGVEMHSLEDINSDFTKHAKIVSTLNIESNPVNAIPLIIPPARKVFELLDIDYVNKTSLDFIKNVVSAMIATRKQQSENKFKDTLQNLMNAHKGFNGEGQQEKKFIYEAKENSSTERWDMRNDEFKKFKSKGLSDDELIANSLIVLMAGYDTTATTLTWMTYLLATNQHIQDKVREEIDQVLGQEEPTQDNVSKLKYTEMFLCETLRLYPAANRTGRDAAVDTDVLGCKIPKNLSITVPIFAMHRMPEYWDDPDSCIPERFSPERKHKINPYVYMPFGVGPRSCVGMRMAKSLCKIIIAKLLQDFTLNVNSLTENPPVLEKSLLTKPQNGIYLKLTVRKRTWS